jgi:HECT-like Ubiquitin-conjugating enzyme (E2)-binding
MDKTLPNLSTLITDITAFKLYKYRLNQSQSFSYYFVKEVIDMAKAHATYKYLIVDQVNDKFKVLFWILNWNSELGVIINEKILFRPSLKVLFKVYCTDDGFKNDSANKIVEQLVLPRECILELVTRMEKSNSVMPISMQKMKGFKVAMLPY